MITDVIGTAKCIAIDYPKCPFRSPIVTDHIIQDYRNHEVFGCKCKDDVIFCIKNPQLRSKVEMDKVRVIYSKYKTVIERVGPKAWKMVVCNDSRLVLRRLILHDNDFRKLTGIAR